MIDPPAEAAASLLLYRRGLALKAGRRAKTEESSSIDIHVGGRLRLRRTLLGLSQQELGRAVDLTFQQVQKYERGTNRISASRLFEFSRVLRVPVAYFFDDIGASPIPGLVGAADASNPEAEEKNPAYRRETLELVRAYYRIGDEKTRRSIAELILALVPDEEEKSPK